ncbi:MAG: rRNA maturation RNase YbeY [Rhizobiaceae bacterium]
MSEPLLVDLTMEAGDWPPEDELAAIVSRATEATLAEMDIRPSEACELGVLFTDDDSIAALNGEWRDKNKPTNVLSFPSGMTAPAGQLPPLLGDIVLASQTINAEAALDGKPFEHHLSHLIVHGLLHLLGHDHEDDEEAEAMEALERRVLARLAIPDPYG